MRYKRKEKLWVRKFYRNGEDWDSIRLFPWNWSRKWEPKKCLCCGKRLYTNSWDEEYRGTVEEIEGCLPCNYKNHWSYGRYYLSVGSWSWEGNEILDSVFDDFKLQINSYKNKRSRLIQLYWKKKKRQRKRGGRR